MDAATKAKIDVIIAKILGIEKGYSNHPADRGGKTKHGITEVVARSYGWGGPMEKLPLELAIEIYWDRHVRLPRFDTVIEVDDEIGLEVTDTGVVMGPATAAIFLQRWLNGFNCADRYDDLFIDGRVGPATIDALRKFLAWRGDDGKTALIVGLNSVQGGKFLGITEHDESQRAFLFGWMMKRVVGQN